MVFWEALTAGEYWMEKKNQTSNGINPLVADMA
jgi:hypothetical protein